MFWGVKVINRIKEVLYGRVIGEILGLPVEYKLRNYLKKNLVFEMTENPERGMCKGYWLDDTQIALPLRL